jgi:hypothetical protein
LFSAKDQMEGARLHLLKCLNLALQLEDQYRLAACLDEMAGLAVTEQDAPRALWMVALADRVRERWKLAVPPKDVPARKRRLAAISTRLGDDAFRSLNDTYSAESIEEATDTLILMVTTPADSA